MPGKRAEYLTWEQYFMGNAILTSARSKDPSNIVGACIVNQEHKILSSGYNGLTRGMDDDEFYWDSRGEQTGELDKIKDNFVVHAERNAILNYRGNMNDLEEAILYVTWYPCLECTKEIIQAGIKKVIYLRNYSKIEQLKLSKYMFKRAGVEVLAYNPDKDFSKEEVRESTEEIQKILKRFSK